MNAYQPRKIKYITKIQYINIPFKDFKTIVKEKEIKNAVRKSVKKEHIKDKEPKPTIMYAPKKFIKIPNKKMDFMIGINKDKSEFIYLEGKFENYTYQNFKKFMKQSSTSAKEIKINSNGGVVKTAMQIGAYVYDNKWDTGVDKEINNLKIGMTNILTMDKISLLYSLQYILI